MSKTAILFPGQGAQYLNMGMDFKESFEEYDKVFSMATNYINDLEEVIKGSDEAKLNDTLYTQFAISSMELGIFNSIKDKINYDCVAGFSLGEFVALAVSESYTNEELFDIISLRTKAMISSGVTGAMIAVLRVSYEELINYLNELKDSKNIEAFIANYNSSEQIVLSCKSEVVDDVVSFLQDKGVRKVVPLKVSGPFHSVYYKDAATVFKNSLNHITFKDPNVDLYLNVTGKKFNNDDLKENVERHMYQQVNWYPLINEMINDGITNFIEIGPGQVLSGLMKKINKEVNVISISSVEDVNKLEELK